MLFCGEIGRLEQLGRCPLRFAGGGRTQSYASDGESELLALLAAGLVLLWVQPRGWRPNGLQFDVARMALWRRFEARSCALQVKRLGHLE